MIFLLRIYLTNMIKKLENSNTYREIINTQNTKAITIPYHTDTGIVVSEDNVDELVDIEWKNYDLKIKEIKVQIPDFNIDDIREKLKQRIIQRIGKPLLKVEYIYINSDSILEASKSIESLSNFVEWCVE